MVIIDAVKKAEEGQNLDDEPAGMYFDVVAGDAHICRLMNATPYGVVLPEPLLSAHTGEQSPCWSSHGYGSGVRSFVEEEIVDRAALDLRNNGGTKQVL
jgi:hypothetical protein